MAWNGTALQEGHVDEGNTDGILRNGLLERVAEEEEQAEEIIEAAKEWEERLQSVL